MNDGKPNWWSRPSTAPEAARIPSPPPADDDFPLQAPRPASPAQAPEPVPVAVDLTKDGPAGEPVGAPAGGPALDAVPAPAAPAGQAPAPAPPAVDLTKERTPVADERPEEPHEPPAPVAPVGLPPHDADAAPVPYGRDELPAPPAPQPLHAPDEYRTPPYGEPGPWAPAPPVQRPAAAVPPQAVPAPAAPVPHPQPQNVAPAPWVQYDPWGAGPTGVTPVAPPAKKKPGKGLALVGALLLALVTGVIGGGVGAYVERHGGLTTVELPQAGAADTGRAPESVAGIAASALPGVVTLHVSGGGGAGTGTGFVLDTRGHILTNNHVVDGAGSSGDITVTFSSGESADAELVGKDAGYDLAVVRVTGVSGLKPLPLGNSDNVRVGDPVVAIGAPFDLSNTVTSGIISAKERPITAGGEKGDGSDISYVDALQTDAPINPGNSGGPLLDSRARVIGINSAIRAAGGSGDGDGSGEQAGSIGLGFAIPVNQGKRVAEELINTGKATHPVIGVSLDMQFNGDGARVGEKGKDGAPSVTPGGPAARAGLRPGDVIVRVDGQRVHNGEELIVKIRAHRPGDRLELTLKRGGREITKTLTLGSSQGT
ncbi:trypsin-like peptidase domain-containing protein [Streptomyces sp.]|uniref:S1C family serine protease n=2 Tax=Streptomyces sp. TaxID=1931 RepID=UPI002811DBAA|nr:trypsin-like peptidase domain-containing protein [Streptomyces sp.]